MVLRLRQIEVTEAVFYSPDAQEPADCQVVRDGGDATVTVLGGRMKMYGLLKLQLNAKGGDR